MAENKEKLVQVGSVEIIAKTKERAEQMAIEGVSELLGQVSDQTGETLEAILWDKIFGES